MLRTTLRRIYSTVTVPKVAIPLSFIGGIGLGVALLAILNSSNQLTWVAVLSGAILSVVIERIFDFTKTLIEEFRDTHPLRKILKTITTEDAVIYFSPFFRDLDHPEQSTLYRNDRERQELPVIAGTQYVVGKGDAMALSFIMSTIQRVASKDHKIDLEEDWLALDKWGKNAICIGAHNAKTREILEKFKNTFFRFRFNYSVIVKDTLDPKFSKQSEMNFVPAVYPKKAPDSSVIDYGIILKLKDQFHANNKPIFIIAGIGDWGTAGAAYYLQNHFIDLPLNDETFGVLIEVPSGYQSARKVDFDTVKDYLVEA